MSTSAWKNLRMWTLCVLMMVLDVSAKTVDQSQTAALRWLTDMRQAVSGLSYKGVVAYLKDNQVESFQLFHSAKGGREQERLVAMNSPLREVIRSAEKVTCYFSDTRKVFVENKPASRSALLDLPEDLTRLQRYYRFNLRGQEYVTQRLSQVVGIEPRDDYRYARLIWVDVASKLPLKFELLDEDGVAVEQMIFTSVSLLESIPEEELEPSVGTDALQWQINQKERLPMDSLRWTLRNVPQGFLIVSYVRLKRPPADRSVEHILLSDGFSSVSIYIEERKGEGLAREHPSKVGMVNARSTRIDDYLVTVMGEVPARTVQLIADGLSYRDKPSP